MNLFSSLFWMASVCGMFEYLGHNGNGGENLGMVSSQSVCASLCYKDPTCVAADFDRNSGVCYKHVTLTTRQRNPCCVRYERICQAGGEYQLH